MVYEDHLLALQRFVLVQSPDDIGCRFGAIEGNHFAFGRCEQSSSWACALSSIFSAFSKSA